MDLIHIAELSPELPTRDSKLFRAAVTLIWPYSSSQREFALLLAEPDFRLRRKKGQVRARFSGSSAKALATTGVGIGDEVVLSLRGAQFVQEGAVSTPGRSIDWELQYAQTVVARVLRDGTEIANLDLLDAAPTPAPPSPVRRETISAPSPAHQWSSPAFLKRARLSDGPFFEAPYDPLADENAEGHDKKRRRKSYRDWKAWTFNARTPSPDKEDASMGEDLDYVDASPSRPTQLPDTPVSPPKPDLLSVATGPLHRAQNVDIEEQPKPHAAATFVDKSALENAAGSKAPPLPNVDDFVRDNEYYDLYAGPDENPPADTQYAFGGDTEVNTEEDEDAQEDTEGASFSATEVNTEDLEEDRFQEQEPERLEVERDAGEQDLFEADAGSVTEEDGQMEILKARNATENTVEDARFDSAGRAGAEHISRVEDAPAFVMPPPTLATLDTSFLRPTALGMLTPIGKEPASPTLEPLDSALLPLPSPFPGEHDTNTTSYLDHVPTSQQPVQFEVVEEEEPPSEASYILENSFFSSTSSSKNLALHQDHETAFTPVRFTFGMDGAGYSRPLEISSPAPEVAQNVDEIGQYGAILARSHEADISSQFIPHELPPNAFRDSYEATQSSPLMQAEANIHPMLDSISVDEAIRSPQQSPQSEKGQEPEVIELSSDSEEDESEESATESMDEDLVAKDVDDEEPVETSNFEPFDAHEDMSYAEFDEQEDTEPPTSTNLSAAVSEVVDLGSPPGSSDVEELFLESQGDSADEDTADDLDVDSASPSKATVKSADMESHREFTAMDFAPAVSAFITNTPGEAATHTPLNQETQTAPNTGKDSQASIVDDCEPRIAVDDSDPHLQDHSSQEDPFSPAPLEADELEEPHPDIKMESIEEDSVVQQGAPDIHDEQGGSEEVVEGPSGEIRIDVPEEGHKLGEVHTISVPTTGPARNTRSKAKTSVSPTKEEHAVPKRTTRSTRSKASMTPSAQTTLSPPRTGTRSTMSPSQDATQTSPYSLRSQSKLLSPTKSTSAATAATRRSPRKHASQRSVDSIPDIGPSQRDDPDLFMTSFEPSQELGASQGRYSNVAFVKDSEEESLRSEQSFSTVKYSDDWNTFTNFSDPVVPQEEDPDAARLKPPPATAPAPEPEADTGAKAKWKKSKAQVIIQPPPSSPSRKLRSVGSMEAALPSPRTTRTTRRHVYNVSSSPPQPAEELPDDATPKASSSAPDVAYPALPGEGENDELRGSPPAPMDIDELKRSSPPAVTSAFPLVNQQSIMDSNTLITPEATQQANMESQASLVAGQQQQSLPLTPQLTQTTSAGVHSFTKSITVEDTLKKTPTKPSSTIVTRSTPRRNATQTDVASTSISLGEHSPDVSSDIETTLVDKPEGPSIGLSTPLAYYTPLNSLTYFLNRSSQFHTASNPDVLALVTSATTTAQRASKGPKDWSTTLHITDASTWPATTTVNIFRAYQTALPVADAGDIILLRAFAVKSLNRHPTLISAEESSWCVWRYHKPVWGAKRGAFGEVKAREEVRGPVVERGEGEWREVEKLREWYSGKVKVELEEREIHTRSHDKAKTVEGSEETPSQVQTRSKGKGRENVGA